MKTPTQEVIDDTNRKIDVMKAFTEGKTVEFSLKGENRWTVASSLFSPAWDWHDLEYRVKKKEPMVVWALVEPAYPNPIITISTGREYLEAKVNSGYIGEIIKLQQVDEGY